MAKQGGEQLSSDQIAVQSGTISGATAGTVSYSQLNIGGIKITFLYFNGYENDGTTNDTITFPIPYTDAPTAIAGNSTLPAMTQTTTVLSITSPDATTTYTGTAIVMGI